MRRSPSFCSPVQEVKTIRGRELPIYRKIAESRKFRRALKPGGTLSIVDSVQANNCSGASFALLFRLIMLVHTVGGATYRKADYRAWLAEAGSRDLTLEKTAGPASRINACQHPRAPQDMNLIIVLLIRAHRVASDALAVPPWHLGLVTMPAILPLGRRRRQVLPVNKNSGPIHC
jgi:hypothetical protein